jgi:hypothetical protein
VLFIGNSLIPVISAANYTSTYNNTIFRGKKQGFSQYLVSAAGKRGHPGHGSGGERKKEGIGKAGSHKDDENRRIVSI